MIPVSEAIGIVREKTAPLEVERVEIADAVGRILAEDVFADCDLPPFDRAQMDGYAVRSADLRELPARLRVVGEAAAGRGWRGAIRKGEAVRIMTGAPLPAGADAVEQVELTREAEDGSTVRIERATEPGQFYVPRASERRGGEGVRCARESVRASRATTGVRCPARARAPRRPAARRSASPRPARPAAGGGRRP